MSLLLESIYLNDGVFRNLSYHEARMRDSVQELYHEKISLRLVDLLFDMPVPSSGLFKTRILYDSEIRKVEYVSYVVRPVQSLKIIHDNSISYNYKFQDRSDLDNLFAQRDTADDILIVRNGLITDTSYANIIFKKGGRWLTPDSYLLNGTMRQSLLNAGLIEEIRIDVSDLKQYQSARLINSMLGMDGPEIPIDSIL
jgi:4-amino-4-deoxychorismate lyase